MQHNPTIPLCPRCQVPMTTAQLARYDFCEAGLAAVVVTIHDVPGWRCSACGHEDLDATQRELWFELLALQSLMYLHRHFRRLRVGSQAAARALVEAGLPVPAMPITPESDFPEGEMELSLRAA